jgi:hypothetical protein
MQALCFLHFEALEADGFEGWSVGGELEVKAL